MNLEQRTAVFKALGHSARLKMVDVLEEGERCVCDLVELVGLQWSTVSRHLSILKEAGVVSDEKRGKQVFYRLELACVSSFNRCLVNPGEGAEAGLECACSEN